MQPQAPPSYAASPLGSFPELANMYASNFSSPLSNAQTDVQAQQDTVTVENQKRAAAAAEAAAKERADAFANKDKYTIQPRSDGGFGFYGPDGKEVSAAQYADNTKQKLTDVLKDSQNPIDIRYINDAKNLTSYLQARAQYNVDPNQQKIADAIEKQVNPIIQKNFGVNLHQANPQQLINFFQQNYPTIYGANQNNAPGFSGSSQFLPSPDNLYNQAGGQKKFNRGTGSHNVNSANPTGY